MDDFEETSDKEDAFPDIPSTQQTPEKKEDLPELPDIVIENCCQGQQQNKTKSIFIVQTLKRKENVILKEIENCKPFLTHVKSREHDVIILFKMESRHTLTAMQNRFKKCFTIAPFMVLCANDSKFDNLLSFFNDSLPNTTPPTLNVNKMILELAEKTKTNDPVRLLGLCLSFAQPTANCLFCKGQLHDSSLHNDYRACALELRTMRDCAAVCKNACTCLEAQNKFKTENSTRKDVVKRHVWTKLALLINHLENDKINKRDLIIACKMMETICSNVKRGLKKYDVEEILKYLISTITEAKPKEQCIILMGAYNTGKTTLAGGLRALFDGVTLNVNCHEQQLNFELGCALGKLLVVFEDVLGNRWPERWMGEKQDLLPGKGFTNLNLRKEHLDGSCVVMLERKHQNKQECVFPPSIITCNPYYIPDPLKPRVKIFTMNSNNYYKKWYKANGHLCLERLLTSSHVMVALLVKHWPEFLTEDAPDSVLLDVRDLKEQIIEEEYSRMFDESLSQGSEISL